MSTQEPESVSEQTPNPNAQQVPGAAPGPTADPERIGPKNVGGNGQPARSGAPTPPSGRPGVSQRKLDANRANAQKSTGPIGEEGKRITRMNALRHGLLAREVVIRLGDSQEDFTEFLELLDDLWETYKPVGRAEELEVENIARCYWMKPREARYANAIIRERTLGARRRAEQRRAEAFAELVAQNPSGDLLEETAHGLQYIIEMMETVKTQMQDKALVKSKAPSEELQELLRRLITAYPEEFLPTGEAKTLSLYGRPTLVVDATYVRQVVAAIDQHLARLRPLHRAAVHFEEVQLRTELETRLPIQQLEGNERYLRKVDGQLERSIERLAALQERRKASGRIWPPKAS